MANMSHYIFFLDIVILVYENMDVLYKYHDFLLLIKLLLENGGYAAIATHDLIIIDACEKYIKSNNIPGDRYEFQALYGVPIQNTLKRLLNDGHTVRIYVPYGKDWYPYSMRRLKENPDLAGYIFKDFFNIKSK